MFRILNSQLTFKRFYGVSGNVKSTFMCSEVLNNEEFIGKNVKVFGWVKAIRRQKNISFIMINDGLVSENLQVVCNSDNIDVAGITFHSSIQISGKLIVSENKQQNVEIEADDLNVLSDCNLQDEYPYLPRKRYNTDYTRQFQQYRPKLNGFSALMRVRSSVFLSFHNYFAQNNYVEVSTPTITSNDCEGGGEVFLVKSEDQHLQEEIKLNKEISPEHFYFDKPTFLTVSSQLHLEAACNGIAKVYTIAKAFRAENSKSTRHLSEFYMLEAEQAFVDDMEHLLDMIEDLFQYNTKFILDKCSDDIKIVDKNIDLNEIYNMTSQAFIRLTYREAFDIFENNSNKFDRRISYGESLGREHELFLVKHFGNKLIFLIDWPEATKPFYMRMCKYDKSLVSAVDLLAPRVGELCGGGLRENNFQRLKNKLCNNKLLPQLSWYLDLRKYGSSPTAGYGLGIERYLQLIFGIPNIKDVIPFPRAFHDCKL